MDFSEEITRVVVDLTIHQTIIRHVHQHHKLCSMGVFNQMEFE